MKSTIFFSLIISPAILIGVECDERSGRRERRIAQGLNGIGRNKMKKGPLSENTNFNKRDLRGSTRYRRGGKSGGKSGKGSNKGNNGHGGITDDVWMDDDFALVDDVTIPDPDSYFIAPFSCAGQCIDADGADGRTGELTEAIVSCDASSDAQKWIAHQVGSYVKIENYEKNDMCISVDYIDGDTQAMVNATCEDGDLALLSCNSPAAYWYFTGGQLLSSFCWARGISTSMTAVYNDTTGECDSNLIGAGVFPNEAIFREDTFMFVDQLPE